MLDDPLPRIFATVAKESSHKRRDRNVQSCIELTGAACDAAVQEVQYTLQHDLHPEQQRKPILTQSSGEHRFSGTQGDALQSVKRQADTLEKEPAGIQADSSINGGREAGREKEWDSNGGKEEGSSAHLVCRRVGHLESARGRRAHNLRDGARLRPEERES
eukprot:6201908-Pleurochrysis_carterae.AAC.2